MEWDTCMKRCVPLAENWRMECKRLERLQAPRVEETAIRDAALEEAAKEVDWHACRYLDSHLKSVAAGIRALKGRDMKREQS